MFLTFNIYSNDINIVSGECVVMQSLTLSFGKVLGLSQDISGKQDKIDVALQTIDKTVVGAINELRAELVGVSTLLGTTEDI